MSASLRTVVIGLCGLSAIFGISVAAISSWSTYIKSHSLAELYPEAEIISKNPQISSVESRQIWNDLKLNWDESQFKDIALVDLAIATGLTQLAVGMIITFGLEKASVNTLARRYILANLVIISVLVVINISTASAMQLNIATRLKSLNLGFSNTHPVVSLWEFGNNSFNLWLAFDIVFLLMSICVICAFMRIANSSSSELLIFADNDTSTTYNTY